MYRGPDQARFRLLPTQLGLLCSIWKKSLKVEDESHDKTLKRVCFPPVGLVLSEAEGRSKEAKVEVAEMNQRVPLSVSPMTAQFCVGESQ